MKEFQFTFMGATNKVILGDLTIKITAREFPISSFKYFAHAIFKKYEAFTFLYLGADLKMKKTYIYSEPGGDPFKELMAELNNRFPEKNLNTMDRKEAIKIIKSKRSNAILYLLFSL